MVLLGRLRDEDGAPSLATFEDGDEEPDERGVRNVCVGGDGEERHYVWIV
jgi:hypothetical protein